MIRPVAYATLVAALLTPLINAQKLHHPTLRFTKVADTATPIPGGSGLFTGFVDARDFDGRTVVFDGYGNGGQEGLYSFRDGSLELLVNRNTLAPGTAQTFSIFFDVAVSGNMAVFTAGWPGGSTSGCQFAANEGVFAVPLGTTVPMTLADSSASGIQCFHGVDLDHGQVVVTGGNLPVDVFHNHQGTILRLLGAQSLQTWVDVSTPVPGGGGATFVGFDQEVSLRDGSLAFGEIVPNSSPPLMGIYVDDGSLRVIADATTPVPGGTGTFQDLRGMNYDGQEAAFRGTDANGFAGVYVGSGPGDLRVIADRTTRVPGTAVNFLGFSNPLAFADGIVAFSGYWGGGGTGLFTSYRGKVRRVLVKGDTVGGNVVEQAFCYAGQLVGNRLLVRVIYQGFSGSGLHVAELPIPATLDE